MADVQHLVEVTSSVPAVVEIIAGTLPATRIHSGMEEPGDELGRIGDLFIDLLALNFYGPKTSLGWGDPISLSGPPGPKGDVGSEGPPGPPGEDATGTYVHHQEMLSSSWVILHNLGFYPNVSVIESDGSEIEGLLQYNSPSQITLTFSVPVSGTAYLT